VAQKHGLEILGVQSDTKAEAAESCGDRIGH
jgi:hypothetical protein